MGEMHSSGDNLNFPRESLSRKINFQRCNGEGARATRKHNGRRGGEDANWPASKIPPPNDDVSRSMAARGAWGRLPPLALCHERFQTFNCALRGRGIHTAPLSFGFY